MHQSDKKDGEAHPLSETKSSPEEVPQLEHTSMQNEKVAFAHQKDEETEGETQSSSSEKRSSLELLQSVYGEKPRRGNGISHSERDLPIIPVEEISDIMSSLSNGDQFDSSGYEAFIKEKIESSWIGRNKENLLSPNMGSIFIISNALEVFLFEVPHALMKTGWSGVYFILLCGLNSFYSGFLLARCWISMEKQWPEYKGYCRTPYLEIGYRVGGNWLKRLVILGIITQQMGLCMMKFLILAKFIDRLVGDYISVCMILVTCGVLIIPFTFFETPKDYPFMGKLGFGISCVTVFLLIFILVMDKERVGQVTYIDYAILNSFYIIGTLLTSFNAGPVYPNIQIDMQDRKQFRQSLFNAYLIIIYLYLPISVLSYGVYGDQVKPDLFLNFFENEKLNALVILLEMICIVHMSITLVLQLNPISLTIEEVFNLPPQFTFKRCLVRALVPAVIVLLQLKSYYMIWFIMYARNIATILMTFTFPSVFFIVLEYNRGKKCQVWKIRKKEWFFLFEVTVFSIIGLYSSWAVSNHQLKTMKNCGFDCYNSTEFWTHHL